MVPAIPGESALPTAGLSARCGSKERRSAARFRDRAERDHPTPRRDRKDGERKRSLATRADAWNAPFPSGSDGAHDSALKSVHEGGVSVGRGGPAGGVPRADSVSGAPEPALPGLDAAAGVMAGPTAPEGSTDVPGRSQAPGPRRGGGTFLPRRWPFLRMGMARPAQTAWPVRVTGAPSAVTVPLTSAAGLRAGESGRAGPSSPRRPDADSAARVSPVAGSMAKRTTICSAAGRPGSRRRPTSAPTPTRWRFST